MAVLGERVSTFKKQHSRPYVLLNQVACCDQNHHAHQENNPSKDLLTLVVHSKASILPNYRSRLLAFFEIEELNKIVRAKGIKVLLNQPLRIFTISDSLKSNVDSNRIALRALILRLILIIRTFFLRLLLFD